jgi:hypothetical protein
VTSALGISGVSAVLETALHSVFIGSGLGSVIVSAVAPDIVQSSLGSAPDAYSQVNLFLHQVTLNAAWRNMDLPSLASDGSSRRTNPPLALDLHYLLTAYASADYEAEALLGYAVQFILETPVLPRTLIRAALASLPATNSNPVAKLLSSEALGDQIEMIKLAPATLSREEMAWVWTALKADYRPTFAFQASVVLMQSQTPLISALPVLQRVVTAQANLLPPLPALTAVNPPGGQPAAVLGDTVTVVGTSLAGVTGVHLSSARLGIDQSLPVLSGAGDTSVQFVVPDPTLPPPQPTPTDLPVGIYLLTAQAPAGPDMLSTNGLPLVIAPRIEPSWTPNPLAAGSNVVVAVPCAPYLRAGQQVALLIGGQEAPADPFLLTTNLPSFTFPALQPTGHPVPVRLRVDGIDSPIIDMTKPPPSPPVFTGPAVQVA